MRYAVRLTDEAEDDLKRLEAFLFEAALRTGDFDLPLRAMGEIRGQMRLLETNPFTCRKADHNGRERELVIPFGHAGYVVLFEVLGAGEVAVTAIRHQREDDYH